MLTVSTFDTDWVLLPAAKAAAAASVWRAAGHDVEDRPNHPHDPDDVDDDRPMVVPADRAHRLP